MTVIFDFIQRALAIPLGFILSLFYDLTNNYILAIILLTAVVKFCFLPQAIQNQKNAVRQKIQNDKIKNLKTKYADSPEKLKAEVKALKKSENVNTRLNTGCLPGLIQFAVLIGLFGIIYTPLTNVLRIDSSTTAEMTVVMADTMDASGQGSNMSEIVLLKETENYKEELLGNGVLTHQQFEDIVSFKENYNFLGVNLTGSPKIQEVNELWIFPLMVFAVCMISPTYGAIRRRQMNPAIKKFYPIELLAFITPVMQFFFTFMFPAGVGLYWAISNILSFAQTVVLNIVYNPLKVSADMKNEQPQAPCEPTEAAQ